MTRDWQRGTGITTRRGPTICLPKFPTSRSSLLLCPCRPPQVPRLGRVGSGRLCCLRCPHPCLATPPAWRWGWSRSGCTQPRPALRDGKGRSARGCPAPRCPSNPPEPPLPLPVAPATQLRACPVLPSPWAWGRGPWALLPAAPPVSRAQGVESWGPGTDGVCLPKARVGSNDVRMGGTLASAPHPWADPAPLDPFQGYRLCLLICLGPRVRGFPRPKLLKGARYRTWWGVGGASSPTHCSSDRGVQEVRGLEGVGWGVRGPDAALGLGFSIPAGPRVGLARSTSAIAVGAAGVHGGRVPGAG